MKHYNSHPFAWRYHDMETLAVSLALCEGIPSVTGGFPSQLVIDEKHSCILCFYPEQAVE